VKSLRARVAIIVLLAFVPAFIVVWIASRNERNDARDDTAAETHAIAANVGDQYGQLLTDTRTLLHTIGSITPSGTVLSQCPTALAALTRQTPAYDNIFIVRADGTVACSAKSMPSVVTRAQAPWLRRAIADHEFVGLAPSATGASGTQKFTIAVGLTNARGQFAVAAQLALDRLQTIVGTATSTKATAVSLVDARNVVLLEQPRGTGVGKQLPDASLATAIRAPGGEHRTVVTDGPDGVRRIYTGERLSQPARAIVLAGIPTSVAYEQTTHWLRMRLVVLLFATLLAVAIALAFAHLSVIRRIRKLVTMTRRIGAGDLNARSDARASDEIGELGRSLDAMADELQAREVEHDALLGAIVEASEEERKRIAGDVHDDSIQVMSAHVMNLQLLRRRVDDPELQQRIRDLEESGRAATARLRDLVFELHSPTLEERGLAVALENLLERTFEGERVAIAVENHLDEEPPLPTSATAYRIAQEAIRNARQHAEPRSVRIQVTRDDSTLLLRVIDDGRGFDPARVGDRPGHLGLRGIAERAAAVGGVVRVESAPGRGTTIECRLPWLRAEPDQTGSPSTAQAASSRSSAPFTT
jgi:signal transduction histidine kinase